jgi:hypothetical protein
MISSGKLMATIAWNLGVFRAIELSKGQKFSADYDKAVDT